VTMLGRCARREMRTSQYLKTNEMKMRTYEAISKKVRASVETFKRSLSLVALFRRMYVDDDDGLFFRCSAFLPLWGPRVPRILGVPQHDKLSTLSQWRKPLQL
jgi:hypothetical protein